MNKEQVGRRLDLVGRSAGSIISVAAWCALHASSAEIIMAAIDEKMRSTSTNVMTRCALLNVIHEVLLTCLANGVPEAGKRGVIMAVGKALPGTVQAVRTLQEADSETFEETLAKVVSWWSTLNIFPSAWIAQLGVKKNSEYSNEAAGESSSMPAQLRHISTLISRYSEKKSEYQQLVHVSQERATSAREDALQQLYKLRAAVDIKLDGGASLVAWLEAERVSLDGNAQSAGVHSSVMLNGEEDILGSFFPS